MQLLEFCSEFGRIYLASGGPTSRLEEYLTELAREQGYHAEVFATPTGLFTTLVHQTDGTGATHTALSRIKQSSMNLGRLCWLEGIFGDISCKKITLAQGIKILKSKKISQPTYTLSQSATAAFVGGFALSYPNYGWMKAALASGFITMVTWWVNGPGLSARIQSGIFRDFVGCLVALLLAGTAKLLLPGPFEAFAIGALIVLVPGLSLTSAISELADQNLISGTAKFMQAMLSLLALGIAFLLFSDLVNALGISPALGMEKHALSLSASLAGAAVGVACFGIIFGIPKRALIGATATGALGWVVFEHFDRPDLLVTAPYTASFVVGLVSLMLSQRFKVPSQTYSVPGILAMLPGMLALASFRTLAIGNESAGVNLGFQVAITAGAIVFGLFTARIPFAIWHTTRLRGQN